MAYCWEKLSHLSKKFRLTTLASQSVGQLCLDRGKKVQIFTTSCQIFTIIQTSILIRDAFNGHNIFISLLFFAANFSCLEYIQMLGLASNRVQFSSTLTENKIFKESWLFKVHILWEGHKNLKTKNLLVEFF